MTPLLILAILVNITLLAGTIVNVIWNGTGADAGAHARLGWGLVAVTGVALLVTGTIAGIHCVRIRHKRGMSAKFTQLDAEDRSTWPPEPPRVPADHVDGNPVYDL